MAAPFLVRPFAASFDSASNWFSCVPYLHPEWIVLCIWLCVLYISAACCCDYVNLHWTDHFVIIHLLRAKNCESPLWLWSTDWWRSTLQERRSHAVGGCQVRYFIPSLLTSHASIAYRKQLPPQWTVGTIGGVWQKSTPSKETTGPAQTNTQSETRKTNRRKCQTAHARPLLEAAGFSQLVLVLDLSLRLLLPPTVSSIGAAFLQLSTTSRGEGRWLNLQIQRSRRIFTRTSQQPQTGSHRCWTYFEQAGTNGTPT